MKSHQNSIHAILAATSALAFASPAHAATIALNNGSFEAPAMGGWAWGTAPSSWTYNYGPLGLAPTGHTGSQSVWNYVNSGWFQISQNSSYTVGQAGEVLTAGVYVAISNLDSGQSTVNLKLLLDGATAVQTQPAYYANQTWTLLTTQYTTVAADIGKTVGMAFGGDGGWGASGGSYTYFDDASLTTSIPEPGTALLGGLGMLSLLRRRRA